MVHFCSVDIYLEKWFGMITLKEQFTTFAGIINLMN